MSTAVVEPAVVIDPQLQTEALSTVDHANRLVVVDNVSREQAAEFGRGIAGLLKQTVDWFGPMKRAAAAAHKAICSKENEVVEPLEAAKRYLSSQIGSYDQRMERERREEEQRQQKIAADQAAAEAKRLSEEQALTDAIELEAAGDKNGAEAVLNNPVPLPVFVPPVVVPRSVPKAQGVSSSQAWKFRVTNLAAVPDEYKILDEKAVGKVVRAMKDKTKIPGIEVYPEGRASFRA